MKSLLKDNLLIQNRHYNAISTHTLCHMHMIFVTEVPRLIPDLPPPRQWEAALRGNDVPHWLVSSPESAMSTISWLTKYSKAPCAYSLTCILRCLIIPFLWDNSTWHVKTNIFLVKHTFIRLRVILEIGGLIVVFRCYTSKAFFTLGK